MLSAATHLRSLLERHLRSAVAAPSSSGNVRSAARAECTLLRETSPAAAEGTSCTQTCGVWIRPQHVQSIRFALSTFAPDNLRPGNAHGSQQDEGSGTAPHSCVLRALSRARVANAHVPSRHWRVAHALLWSAVRERPNIVKPVHFNLVLATLSEARGGAEWCARTRHRPTVAIKLDKDTRMHSPSHARPHVQAGTLNATCEDARASARPHAYVPPKPDPHKLGYVPAWLAPPGPTS
eukprot:6172349-Pleurochrysis_carterae.AAC.4